MLQIFSSLIQTILNAFNFKAIAQALSQVSLLNFIETYKLTSSYWRGANAVKGFITIVFDSDIYWVLTLGLIVVFIVGIVRVIIDLL